MWFYFYRSWGKDLNCDNAYRGLYVASVWPRSEQKRVIRYGFFSGTSTIGSNVT